MITFLLVIIYIAFIGLGLPHSLFGAALESIRLDFGVSTDAVNYVTLIISGCTVISSMLGARLTKKFGTSRVVAVSTLVAAAALLGFSFSPNLTVMCLCAVPLGLSAGATDSSLNNYIALNYSAMHMNFLHCFYGVGVMASPYIMSIMLDISSWQNGYRVIFSIQIVIAAIMFLSLPLWKKVGGVESEDEDKNAKPLSYIKMAKTGAVRLDWLMCISINAIEGVVGTWGASYLKNAHALTEAEAAGAIVFFYAGLAGGRFLSGLLSTKMQNRTVMNIATGIMLVGAAALFVPTKFFAVSALFLVGLGNGPVYPNIMHLTPRHFGKEYSNSLVGSQMATAYFGIMIAPPVFGFLSAMISPAVFPIYIAILGAVFVAASVFFFRRIKNFKPEEAFGESK